jgi:DNA-directed RNA polymerase subunit RPC12/RpoP
VAYVCRACGNRTRFDVVSSRRTSSFHHYDLGGRLRVEDETVLSEVTEEVSCRWCESSRFVEELPPA